MRGLILFFFDFLLLVGIGSIGYGAWLYTQPSGWGAFVFGGAAAIVVSVARGYAEIKGGL